MHKINKKMAKGTKTLLALIAGAAIGAGIGVLFAPEEGKKTRKKIKESLDDVSEDLKNKFNEIRSDAEHSGTQMKTSFMENVEDFLSKTSYKAEEVIETLERKLEQLKRANAKLQK